MMSKTPVNDEALYVEGVDRLALWQHRSAKFKARHFWNVTCAVVRGDVSCRSAWMGIRFPQFMSALAVKSPQRGMVFVCPACLDELDRIDVYFRRDDSESSTS